VPFYGMLRMFAAAVGLASGSRLRNPRHFMIVGNDEKPFVGRSFKPLCRLRVAIPC